MTKVCTKCKQELPLEAFGKHKRTKDGLRCACKECERIYTDAYNKTERGKARFARFRGTAKAKAIQARYRKTAKAQACKKRHEKTDKCKATRDAHRKSEEVAAKLKVDNKRYRQTPKHKATVAAYKQTPAYKESNDRYNHTETHRAATREYQRKRRLEAGERLSDSIKTGIYLGLKSKKNGRHWETLVGYIAEDLMVHLESLFLVGMTWQNYGKWHVDHIIPRLAFHYTTVDDLDFKRCWALDNLQPLWGSDNIRKSAKILKPFQPSLDLQLKKHMGIDKIT